MADFDLSVTIVSWNTVADLRCCLQSLRERADEASFEVIVVDNDSRDGSAEMVEREFAEIRLIRAGRNLGFTAGHNRALGERRGRDAFLLNPDAIVHPGAIRELVAYARAHVEVGILGPKLLNPDGTLQYSCRTFPNPVAAAFRGTFLGRLFPKNRYVREYLMTDWPHDQPREVDWVSGAALYVKGEVMERVGLFDEGFFMFCEEVDWCKRAWEAGFRVRYLPTAVVTHVIGRSTDQVANRMIVLFHRSMLRYYVKHQVSQAIWPARPFLVAFAAGALGLRAFLFILRNLKDEIKRRLSR